MHTLGEPSSQCSVKAGKEVRERKDSSDSRREEDLVHFFFLAGLEGEEESQRWEAGSGVKRPKGKLSSEGGRRVFLS